MAWWAQHIRQSLKTERLARGTQMRPLRVATGCSGTDSPLFALQARFAMRRCSQNHVEGSLLGHFDNVGRFIDNRVDPTPPQGTSGQTTHGAATGQSYHSVRGATQDSVAFCFSNCRNYDQWLRCSVARISRPAVHNEDWLVYHISCWSPPGIRQQQL